jgi:hypothetical protein
MPGPVAMPSRRPSLRRELLEHLARPLLLRLLAPFAAPLAAAGFDVAALTVAAHDDRRPVRALHDLLDDSTDAALAPLVGRLLAIAKVAGPAGREALIQLDTARVLPPLLGPVDLAATASLDHPDLFAAVRVGATEEAMRNFVLYAAAADREPRFDADGTEAMRTALAAWFAARHRSAFCEVFVKRRGDEVHFEVIHGRTPVTREVIAEDLTAKVVTQVNGQRSYVIYKETERLLAVHALEHIKEGLRLAFSSGYGGAPDYFARAGGLLATAPLRDLDAALTPDPALGVAGVELREIDLDDDEGGWGYSVAGDLRVTRRKARIDEDLAREEVRVVHVKLAVYLVGVRRPLVVTLKPARNQLDYNRTDPVAERALLDWLAARGIWRGARGGAVSEAANT